MKAPTVSSNLSSSCRGLVARLGVTPFVGQQPRRVRKSKLEPKSLLLKASVASREHNDMLLDRSAEP
jgi:hypothetical protein